MCRGSWGRRPSSGERGGGDPGRFDASAAASAASLGADAPALSVAAEAAKQDALKRIEHLRRAPRGCHRAERQADELTRVPRGELLMDETFKAQLVAEGETRVQQLRARLERENLVADYMSSKIVAECWDTMETHGSAIVALNTPGLMVHKYPLKAEDKTARLGRRVAFLRRVELAEHEHFKDRVVAEKSGGEEDGTPTEVVHTSERVEVASSSSRRDVVRFSICASRRPSARARRLRRNRAARTLRTRVRLPRATRRACTTRARCTLRAGKYRSSRCCR